MSELSCSRVDKTPKNYLTENRNNALAVSPFMYIDDRNCQYLFNIVVSCLFRSIFTEIIKMIISEYIESRPVS